MSAIHEFPITPAKLWCADCGKNFIHYVAGMPQTICGYCAGEDVGDYE
jgi:hypothetical protein